MHETDGNDDDADSKSNSNGSADVCTKYLAEPTTGTSSLCSHNFTTSTREYHVSNFPQTISVTSVNLSNRLPQSTIHTSVMPSVPPLVTNIPAPSDLSASVCDSNNNASIIGVDTTIACRVSGKEAMRVILGAIDAQVNSVNEMLHYFTKLVKAEKAVQQALFELVPEQQDNVSSSRTNGTGSTGFQRLIPSSTRRRRGTLTGNCVNSNSMDVELSKILNNLVHSTNQQARAFSSRALFHKVVTMTQLEGLVTCHQCLRRTYVECENELQSQVDQYSVNLRTSERKYAKYAERLSQLRAKLTGLCDRRTSYNRKTVETLMQNLENVTRKLYLLHNDYFLAILTANHFQQWLHTRLRPCLLNGIERTMQLTCEVVRHLLVFGGESTPNALPWLEGLQQDRNLSALLEQHNVRFPGPICHSFNLGLVQRVPGGTVTPDSLILNDMTRQSLTDMIHTYRTRELFHRETMDQITRECIQWEEALAQWRAVFAMPLSNPWAPNHASQPSGGTSSFMGNTSPEIPLGAALQPDGWGCQSNTVVPDLQDLWQDDRARPVNLCEVSYRLTICEFELCFASCLAEAHAQLVSHLLHIQSRAQLPTLMDVPTSNAIPQASTDGRLLAAMHGLPDLLDQPSHMSVVAGDTDSTFPLSPSPIEPPSTASSSHPFVMNTPSTQSTPSTYTSSASLSSSRLGGNRLWHSFRLSVSRLRTHFTRSGPLRSSMGAKSGTDLSTMQPHAEHAATPTVIIDRRCGHPPSSQCNPVPELTRVIPTDVHSSDRRVSTTDLPPLHSPSSHISNSDCILPSGKCGLQQPLAESMTEDTCSTILRETDINKEPWFHGVLPRTEVERLLQNQGDFLVRQTNKRASCRDLAANLTGKFDDINSISRSNALRMVLSVNWNGHKHFILRGGGSTTDGGWFLEDGEFPTIRELVECHMLTQTPVTAKSGACLITPIMRPDWALDNKDVQLVQKIGQGNFGEVYRGFYNGCEVAVKTCRVDVGATNLRQKFLEGERTALNFCHPHIVKLIGIAVQSYPIMIVMEYVPGGSLLTYLRKSKVTINQNTLLLLVSDAANGMAYLELKNCIHRDLAARNCLVTEAGRLKIADFGMSREEHIYELSDRHGQIPIKWTAPEALATGRYTIKCDVWSYGVLLWEIFTFGDIPYRFWSNPQTREMVESGYRLPAPDNMPSQIRTQMNNCWLADPAKRPSFAELARVLHFPARIDGMSQWNPIQKQCNGSRPSTVIQESSCGEGGGVVAHKFSRLALAVKDKRTREC